MERIKQVYNPLYIRYSKVVLIIPFLIMLFFCILAVFNNAYAAIFEELYKGILIEKKNRTLLLQEIYIEKDF